MMKNMKLFVLEALVFMLNVLGSRSEYCSLDEDFQRSYVGLALSPSYQNQNSRRIKIIWGNGKFRPGDKIHLFSYSRVYGFQNIYEVIPTTSYGVDETTIEANFREPSLPLFVEQCRKYYVAWIRNGYIRDINCLGNQPTWMFDRRHFLGSQKLADLFIPGTYGSATYNNERQSIRKDNRGYNFNSIVQDLDVMTQLVQGIRYIHVDVGYHPEDDETAWWVHKRNLPLVKLDTIIDQVKSFLQYTREIVVFDVKEFPFGFQTKQNYMDLMDYTRTRFGTFLPPVEYNWTTPLDSIWNLSGLRYMPKMGKVLLNFNFDDAPFAFPEFNHSLINHKSIHSWTFQDYFENLSDAEAPTNNKALLRATLIGSKVPSESMAREMMDQLNPDITIWYHEFWYSLANIVALEFLETSGIVDVAIKSNEFRYKNRLWVNNTQTVNCTTLEPESSYSPVYVMNSPSVKELLIPRIVEEAAGKIYDVFPGLAIFSRPSYNFDD